jgi:hypothetical protein
MTHAITEALIRSTVELLMFNGDAIEEVGFVDLQPTIPTAFEVFDNHDLSSAIPPPGVPSQDYALMVAQYHVLNAALSEHDGNLFEESTERFREEFWERFGEGPDGAKIMKRSYRRKLSDSLIDTLQQEGAEGIISMSEGKRMMDSLTGQLGEILT